jgi:hypothetical protein
MLTASSDYLYSKTSNGCDFGGGEQAHPSGGKQNP